MFGFIFRFACDVTEPVPLVENVAGFVAEGEENTVDGLSVERKLDHWLLLEPVRSAVHVANAFKGADENKGHAGVPAAATRPANLPEGLPWDGIPAFKGQLYINTEAASGGLYYAKGVGAVSDWINA